MPEKPITPEPLVYHFFLRLRKAGYPLGIPEYQTVLQALQGGFGIADKAALLRICKYVWLAYQEDDYEFEYLFEEVLEQYLAASQILAQPAPTNPTPSPPLPTPTPTQPLDTQEDLLPPTTPEPEPPSLPSKPKDASLSPPPQPDAPVGYLPGLIRPEEAIKKAPNFVGNISVARDYLPFRRRQIQQRWRNLRRTMRTGIPTEFDLPATVERLSRESWNFEPVLQAPRRNTTRLMLLFDYGGSMVAFHRFGEELKRTAQVGGYFREVNTYYFYNVPEQSLYLNQRQTDFISWKTAFPPSLQNHTVALIYSDGGAAREHYRAERVQATLSFLQQIGPRVRHLAWLNPLPTNRWWDTPAKDIQEALQGAMFPLSDEGIQQAIRHLKG